MNTDQEHVKAMIAQKLAADLFIGGFGGLAEIIHVINRAKGFWDTERNDGESIALMHSELSEALEGLRIGNPASEKIPEFNQVEEELADTIIRIMDMSHARGWRVPEALIAKMIYNATRPHKHGKSF